ncbi:MAG TPA: tripartite tricarboxylate transporter substrate binding protein [Burkholderiales bacterium]|jgi:tripartite-type tricarboxylate transporter receptor subunit TctC|nr:tripartite tricarboxylate transporter substrate binding protein [Burkholderiales bacterium]HEX2650487.1 tripartite tricarboxylate transporter substrate binding protein [Burkholderiales bacterium]
MRLLLLALAWVVSSLALAQDWPTKTVRLVIPFSPGGSTDFQGRLLCDWLTRHFGQSFVIDHKPGAGSNIGVAEVARSAPDGYTLGWITVASHAINPTLYAKLPFDHLKDFAPVSLTGTFPNLLVVNNNFPVKTVPELIAHLKANPGKFSFASSGQGTSLHLSGEMFKQMTKTEMLHIPYKGGGPAVADVIAGVVQMTFGNMPTVLPHARAGRVRAVAVTSSERWFSAPDIPAIAETVPGFQAMSWHGVAFPAGTPPAIVEKLSAAIREAMATDEMKDKYASGGSRAIASTPAQFAAFIREDTERWAPVIRASGARVE